MRRCAVAVIACIVLAAATAPAFAQAGSAGGSLGKTNKSASGGSEEAPAAKPQPRRSATKHASRGEDDGAPAAKSSGAIAGRWHWDIKCPSASFTGQFDIVQDGSTFTGEFGHTNFWDNGTVSNGKFHGNVVTFDREYMGTDHVRLIYSRTAHGAVMQGPHYNAFWGQCSIVARKDD